MSTYLYIYRLTDDRGFAPCVQDNLLTLSCCKGGQIRNNKPCKRGLRYNIGSKKYSDWEKDDIYILGTFQNRFLYLAKITEVLTMTEYFSKYHNRKDLIYDVTDNKLIRNNHLQDQKVHTDKNQIIRDLAGEYVLLSNDYIYLGKDAKEIDIVNQYGAKRQETKKYNDEIAEKIIIKCKELKDNLDHTPNSPL